MQNMTGELCPNPERGLYSLTFFSLESIYNIFILKLNIKGDVFCVALKRSL